MYTSASGAHPNMHRVALGVTAVAILQYAVRLFTDAFCGAVSWFSSSTDTGKAQLGLPSR